MLDRRSLCVTPTRHHLDRHPDWYFVLAGESDSNRQLRKRRRDGRSSHRVQQRIRLHKLVLRH